MDTKKMEYQVPEHLVLADKLYAKKQHRKVLAQRLDEKQFQYRCIPNKQEDSAREIRWKVAPLVLYTVVNVILLAIVLACLISLITVSEVENAKANAGMGIGFLIAVLVLTRIFVPCVKMWRDTIFHATNISIYNGQEESTRIKITDLQEEIVALDAEIAELESRFQEARDKAAAKYL